jgi:hypothetical protein
MTLRNAILALGLLLLLVSIVRYALGASTPLPIALIVIVLGLILFERTRYRPRISSSGGEWLPTGERFEDPASGKTVEVYQNLQTGERDYRTPGAKP